METALLFFFLLVISVLGNSGDAHYRQAQGEKRHEIFTKK
jgi:hypothetical protein